MIRNSFVHGKRGISDIIASLVLMFIILSAGVVVYSYSIGAFSSSTSFFQLDTNSQQQQAEERFTIIAVWENPPYQLNLTVLNYGQIGLAISAIYVNWTTVSTFFSGKGTTIGNGRLVQVSFASPISIQVGSTYEIIAVSTRGSANAICWKA